MNEIMSILFGLIITVAPILVIGILGYIIWVVIKNKNGKTKLKLSSRSLLQIYLYLISFITLIVAVIGGALVMKVATSYIFNIPFSYPLQRPNNYYEEDMKLDEPISEDCYVGKPIQFYDSEFCFDPSLRKTELITGITLLISMTVLFSLHQYAIHKINQKHEIKNWLEKTYTFLSLIMYSVIGIVTIPLSIYLLTNYLLFEPNSDMYSTPSAPAMVIGITILTIPLWVYFLNRTMRLKEE